MLTLSERSRRVVASDLVRVRKGVTHQEPTRQQVSRTLRRQHFDGAAAEHWQEIPELEGDWPELHAGVGMVRTGSANTWGLSDLSEQN